MPVGFQALLVFVFTYLLLSLFYDTSHYLPQIYLINYIAFVNRDDLFQYLPPAKARASYMIELLMSMQINDFFLPTIEDKKWSVQASLNQESRNPYLSLTYRISDKIIITISFYPVFLSIYFSIASAANYRY